MSPYKSLRELAAARPDLLTKGPNDPPLPGVPIEQPDDETPPLRHAFGLHYATALCGASPGDDNDAPATLDPMAVTCPACRRMQTFRGLRPADRLEKHRRQDPHCTCPDCIAHHEQQQHDAEGPDPDDSDPANFGTCGDCPECGSLSPWRCGCNPRPEKEDSPMDPDANLREQIETATTIRNLYESTTDGGTPAELIDIAYHADRLADLVIALDEWIRKEGALPAAWRMLSRQDFPTR